MNIPEGYKLVPIEPNENMNRHGDMNYSWNVSKIYIAMVAAAPSVVIPAYDEAKERAMLSLLVEARATLETWKDVAPAISLCADIDKFIAKSRARSAG